MLSVQSNGERSIYFYALLFLFAVLVALLVCRRSLPQSVLLVCARCCRLHLPSPDHLDDDDEVQSLRDHAHGAEHGHQDEDDDEDDAMTNAPPPPNTLHAHPEAKAATIQVKAADVQTAAHPNSPLQRLPVSESAEAAPDGAQQDELHGPTLTTASAADIPSPSASPPIAGARRRIQPIFPREHDAAAGRRGGRLPPLLIVHPIATD